MGAVATTPLPAPLPVSISTTNTIISTNASTSTLGNTIVAWNAALTAGGIIGGGYTVTDLGGTGYATVSGGNVVRYTDPASAGLPLTTGSSTGSYFVNSSYSPTFLTTDAGSLKEALSGAVAANTVSPTAYTPVTTLLPSPSVVVLLVKVAPRLVETLRPPLVAA